MELVGIVNDSIERATRDCDPNPLCYALRTLSDAYKHEQGAYGGLPLEPQKFVHNKALDIATDNVITCRRISLGGKAYTCLAFDLKEVKGLKPEIAKKLIEQISDLTRKPDMSEGPLYIVDQERMIVGISVD